MAGNSTNTNTTPILHSTKSRRRFVRNHRRVSRMPNFPKMPRPSKFLHENTGRNMQPTKAWQFLGSVKSRPCSILIHRAFAARHNKARRSILRALFDTIQGVSSDQGNVTKRHERIRGDRGSFVTLLARESGRISARGCTPAHIIPSLHSRKQQATGKQVRMQPITKSGVTKSASPLGWRRLLRLRQMGLLVYPHVLNYAAGIHSWRNRRVDRSLACALYFFQISTMFGAHRFGRTDKTNRSVEIGRAHV